VGDNGLQIVITRLPFERRADTVAGGDEVRRIACLAGRKLHLEVDASRVARANVSVKEPPDPARNVSKGSLRSHSFPVMISIHDSLQQHRQSPGLNDAQFRCHWRRDEHE
jgi:hypothetical protein